MIASGPMVRMGSADGDLSGGFFLGGEGFVLERGLRKGPVLVLVLEAVRVEGEMCTDLGCCVGEENIMKEGGEMKMRV